MKKLIIVLIAATVATTSFAQTGKKKPAQTTPAKVQYTCTMHPEVISDKPGKCPKCGMTLVVKKPAVKVDTVKSKKKMTM
jgi:uncharacterized protein YdeI (BOF family)